MKLTTEIINGRLKRCGIQLDEPYVRYDQNYRFICLHDSNHIPFTRKLDSLFDYVNTKIDYIPCPYCRVQKRIKYLEEYCPNLKILEFNKASTVTSRFYKIKWECKHCGHQFNRTDDEVLRGGFITCNDCPKCAQNRLKRLWNNVFDSVDSYRAQVYNDTEWVNNTYTKYKNSKELHIDHRCSIYDCYRYCIPTWICCSPVNLTLISSTENMEKNKTSSLNISELILSFSEWVINHPEYTKLIQKETI